MHREQRQALYDAKEKRIAQRLTQLREANRSKWAFLFRQQKAEARELDETRKSSWKALLYFLKHRQELKSPGGLVWIFQGLTGYHGVDFWEAMNKRHEEDRKAISARVGEQRREIFAQENSEYRTALEILKHDQAAERRTFREEYERQAPPARPARGSRASRRQKRSTTEKTVREEFESRVRKRAKRIRKRDEQRRGKGQGRERED